MLSILDAESELNTIELMIVRRHLNISFVDAAELIGECSEDQWATYELGYAAIPSDVQQRFKIYLAEYLRIIDLMSKEEPCVLPALMRLKDFREFFGHSSRISWRIYTAIIQHLIANNGYRTQPQGIIADNSPLHSLNLHL